VSEVPTCTLYPLCVGNQYDGVCEWGAMLGFSVLPGVPGVRTFAVRVYAFYIWILVVLALAGALYNLDILARYRAR